MMKSSKVIGPSKSIEGHAAEREKDARSQFALLASAARNTRLVSYKTHAEQEQGAMVKTP
jgi:ribosomal protein S15P/S13E